MQDRPTANPPNRFHTTTLDYDDGELPPASAVTIIDDHSRSIMSENDSPDVGFNFSVNPYRGCQTACAYCMDGETPILLADARTKRLADVQVGDEIYGTRVDDNKRTYVRTRVLAHWSTVKPAYRIELSDQTSLIASGDHRFLSNRGWKYVIGAEQGRDQRPHLTTRNELLGTGRFATPPAEVDDFEGQAINGLSDRRVVSITAVGPRTLYDITTETEDFIANGVISHNCYARPSHEYLDLGAGTDFDTKIVVKRDAPALLRAAFDKPSWRGELVMFSGVTDCYQPVERELELTRRCLEVCLEYRNPVGIISKHALVERDVGLIAELAKEASATLSVSLAWADAELARAIEPWAPAPERRLKVIETFAKAGVRVGVMCAPIIPGLNDNQLVRVLERAAAAGASYAGWVLLRLPGGVAQVFPERLRVAMPLAADKILHRIRETRGGEKLYDSRFGVRGRGEGVYAQTIAQLFDTTVARLGLNRREDDQGDRPSTFRRPDKPTNQLKLF